MEEGICARKGEEYEKKIKIGETFIRGMRVAGTALHREREKRRTFLCFSSKMCISEIDEAHCALCSLTHRNVPPS